MTKGEIGIIIVRVFALLFFLKGMSIIISIPSLFMGESYLTWFYGGPLVLYFCLSGLFWFKAEEIGGKLLIIHDNRNISLPTYDQAMHIVFIGFGLWMISKIIPDISSALAFIVSDGMIGGKKIRGVDLWEYGLRIGFHTGFGLFLILGSEDLRKKLRNIRCAGIEKGENLKGD